MIHHTLEHRLVRAAALWKWQRVIKSMAMVASFAMLVALFVGGLVLLGWATTPAFVYLLIGITLVTGGVAWAVMVVRALDQTLDRQWLAAAVERDQEPLLDRLNAVLELDQNPQDVSAAMYRKAIEKQAATVLRKLPDRSPFSWFATNMHVAAAALLFLLTVGFYAHFQPLRLLAEEASPDESAETGNLPLAIPESAADDPAASALAGDEATEPWGEVRISEPGRNLRVTRHEDIPLLIEAAADRPLVDVFWSTAINLDHETRHALPEFEDPRYAVFQPILRPEELGLGEWDLVYYRAVALAEDDTRYESTTYFVEVIPSRDELDALPNAAYEQLEQITGLIEQQQEVIHQTDRLTDAGDPQQARRIEALAEQENRIAASAESFQVALQTQLGPQVTASFAAASEAARAALQDAETALSENDLSAASDPERTALLRLADSRRQLADLVRDHRAAFEPSSLAAIEERASPRRDARRSRFRPAAREARPRGSRNDHRCRATRNAGRRPAAARRPGPPSAAGGSAAARVDSARHRTATRGTPRRAPRSVSRSDHALLASEHGS